MSGIFNNIFFFFSSRRRHTRFSRDWNSDVCSSDLRAALGDGEIVGTVIRFAMVHGERDAQRRFYWLFKRMADRRPAILLSEGEAAFRSSRTHVDNAAHAVVLVATDERAAGRTYNVGEPDTLDTLAWAREIAALTDWRGELVVIPSGQLPAHLRDARPDFYAQHLVADTSDRKSV